MKIVSFHVVKEITRTFGLTILLAIMLHVCRPGNIFCGIFVPVHNKLLKFKHIFNLTITLLHTLAVTVAIACTGDETGCQHTGCDEDEPWFVVDLGSNQRFTHIVLANRLDQFCKCEEWRNPYNFKTDLQNLRLLNFNIRHKFMFQNITISFISVFL